MHDHLTEFREAQDRRMAPMYEAARVSADVSHTGTPVEGEDLTEDLRRFARKLGLGEVGFTRHDRHTRSPPRSVVAIRERHLPRYEQDYLRRNPDRALIRTWRDCRLTSSSRWRA